MDKSTVPMRWRSEQTIDVGGHPAVVRTKPRRNLSAYFVISLEVDGQPVEPDPGTSGWEY